MLRLRVFGQFLGHPGLHHTEGWKVPLKYRAVLLFPSGPLGLGQEADTMVWGGYLQSGGNKNQRAHKY